MAPFLQLFSKSHFLKAFRKMYLIFILNRANSFLRPTIFLLNNVARFSENINSQIESMIKSDKVVLFMKGIPNAPKCGFSNAVTQIFRMHGIKYTSYDVLANEELREGIKKYSNWPTIPQVYVEGQFIGGCDILLQMHQSGELIEILKKIGIKSALQDQS